MDQPLRAHPRAYFPFPALPPAALEAETGRLFRCVAPQVESALCWKVGEEDGCWGCATTTELWQKRPS